MSRANSLWLKLKAKYHGWMDGGKNLPPSNAAFPGDSEKLLLAEIDRQRLLCHAQGARNDKFLEARQMGLWNQVRDLWDRHSKASAETARLKAALEPLTAAWEPQWALIALLAFGIGETAWNFLAFEILGGGGGLTLIMALVLATMFPVAAHVVGIHTRFAIGAEDTSSRTRHAAIALVPALVMLGALWGVNRLREAYVLRRNPGLGHGYFWSCFSVAAGLFVAAAACAFLAAESTPERNAAWRRMRTLEKEKLAAEKEWRRPFRELLHVAGERGANLKDTEGEVAADEKSGAALIHLYRLTNRRRRQDAAPKAFDQNPEFEPLPFWTAPTMETMLDELRREAPDMLAGLRLDKNSLALPATIHE